MSKSAHILVVDDEPQVLQLTCRILQTAGYTVSKASTGEQGLELTRKLRPAMVLLDVVLSDTSGVQVCRAIKSDPELIDITVVLISGEMISVDARVGGFETGADDYLTKPYYVPELLARIKTIMRLRDTTAALRASEKHYRRVLEMLPGSVFLTDRRGRLTSVNHEATTMLKYGGPEEFVQRKALRLIHPGDRKRFSEEIRKHTSNQGMMRGAEYRAIRKNGSCISVELSAVESLNVDGRAIGLVVVARDITDEKWAKTLLQVQRDFGVFLSSANDLSAALAQLLYLSLDNEGIDCGWILLMDSQTGMPTLAMHRGISTPSVKKMAQIAKEIGPSLFNSEDDSCAGNVDTGVQMGGELKKQGVRAFKAVPIRHGTTIVAVLVIGSHSREEIPDESCQTVQSVASQAGDAIARIRAEQSLRANQQMLEKTFHSLRSAVFVLDAARLAIQECNPTATVFFGYSRQELLGMQASLLHKDEESFAKFKMLLGADFQDKGIELELPMRNKLGSVFPSEQSVKAIRDSRGHVISWINVIRDITERKRIEEELRRLPHRIMEAQEGERLRVARELHDGVNQLIASAKLRLNKVQETGLNLGPSSRELLNRSDRLLVQALEENRRIAQNLRPSDLDELGLAIACWNFCQQVQTRTSLTFETIIPQLNVRLSSAVELNVFRILQEAVANIEKHARAKRVKVQMEEQPRWVILTVHDDGQGFEVSAKRRNVKAGGGLGLTNMQGRANLFGGTCEIESRPGGGTTVTVRIPLAPHLIEAKECAQKSDLV